MPSLWRDLFDHIYVVSLPASKERRAYVTEHLKANGTKEFEWHDACDANHPLVQQAYELGLVHDYPPCFRCGKTECGREDCNNVLLPVQVAVFVTYVELWKKIAAKRARALVFEDDVRLHESWRDVLPYLKEEISAGHIPFHAQTPCLLRMGWALSGDHDKLGPVRLEDSIRMSNPCFAVTSAYAELAVSRFTRIEHTADVFFHQQVPCAGQAFTVFPPIASELSWSTGEVASLIHPKEVRVEYLMRSGRNAAADEARAAVRAHVKHMHHRRFLVTGHPRTGTGYAANLLNQLGFDVGHEKAGRDGLSSWMFAADAECYPYAEDAVARSRRSLHWDMLLHIVRDPQNAVPSIMRENEWSQPSYQFRRLSILNQVGIDLDAYGSNMERAVMSLVGWNKMILEMKPDFWFRLDEAHHVLPGFLSCHGLIGDSDVSRLSTAPVNADKLYQGIRRPRPHIDGTAWSDLSAEAKSGLRWYCGRFGYELPNSLAENTLGD
jgi:hypothetical protein